MGYRSKVHSLHPRRKREVVCHCRNRVKGKVVVLTGATSGIGYYTALDLARKDSKLYLACRNPESGEKTAKKLRRLTGNQNVRFAHLDLTNFSTIRDFASSFQKREGKLDILINNAGIFRQPSILTTDGFEITYQTNYLGVFLLTSLLQDTIRGSSNSRIVFLSTEAHRRVTPEDVITFDCKKAASVESFEDYIRLYGISKLAVHLYAHQLSKELPEVILVLVNPGNVWTEIYRNCWTSWEELLMRIKCAYYMRLPEEGSQSSIHAVNAPVNVDRKYITDSLGGEGLCSYDEELTRSFITKSKEMVGL